MSSSSWGLARRVGFRFGFLYTVLYMLPFPGRLLPWTDWPVEQYSKLQSWGVTVFAENVLVIAGPSSAPNGSGDRTYDYVQLLLFVVLSVLGTIVWSVLDRRRTSYPGLASWLWIAVRYYVAY